ncbi:MAG: 4,5-DOPA dioxygenase extradiol [Betaproteobacteria bacterium]|nr:4,5-DOPA dioxygenase extradiol [Betaproteobacteria bacterium]
MNHPMPALFLGHGNPMHALLDNAYTRAWHKLGSRLPRPDAILAISAHWQLPRAAVTAMDPPRTIHDFGGFPRALYGVQYPCPGDPVLARRVAELLGPASIEQDQSWGLDHGTWSLLCHLYPDASVPVIQLAMEASAPPSAHYERGRQLAALRNEGVLILGSGNIVHNLERARWEKDPQPEDWARRFDGWVREKIASGEDSALLDPATAGPDGTLSVPTPEHYWPLLYVLGSRRAGDRVSFPVEGIDMGTISMTGVLMETA